MVVNPNPFGSFRAECESKLRRALTKMLPGIPVPTYLDAPPDPRFGELASSVCFELGKRLGRNPQELAVGFAHDLSLMERELIAEVEAVGGYVNFRFDFKVGTGMVIESILALGEEYGSLRADGAQRFIVEHTSVNPIHPIHIGQGRNSVLGDALARILRARGHAVSRHFYIDDTGRQVGILAYGYLTVKGVEVKGKPDHFLGRVYSVTACLLEIHSLKRRLKEAAGDEAQAQKLQAQLDDWTGVAAELEAKHKQLFDRILDEMKKDPDPEASVARLMVAYEKAEAQARSLVREVVQLCLDGFRQTLARLEIEFDSWDWESELLWAGMVADLVSSLERSRWVKQMDRALELDAEAVVHDLALEEELGVRSGQTVPPLVLTRSDGTTLYTTRDVAYSLKKFQSADQVINVIGVEQSLAQLHLRIALCALGRKDMAKRLRHFAFGLVELPGYKMSGRRGRYVTLDEVLDEAILRANGEVQKRNPELPEGDRKKIAEAVGLSAVKYALLAVEPAKNVIFVWDRVVNFEVNSAPFINYAYTRAHGIIRRIGEVGAKPRFEDLTEPVEQELMMEVAKFPEVVARAADQLRPDDIAIYANHLAQKFHEYYEKVDVSHLRDEGLKAARIAFVKAVQVVLRNAMSLLGIRLAERM